MHHFHYPKITLLIILIISAYYIFRNPYVDSFVASLNNWNYIGVLIAGMLFAFGFTAPFAIGFFIILNPENLFLAGIIGGLGALISNFLILKFIRFSFMDEFKKFIKIKSARKISSLKPTLSKKIKYYLLYVFAGIVIASPFPDEVGVSMLAGLGHIKPTSLIFISFILHTLGVFVILNL